MRRSFVSLIVGILLATMAVFMISKYKGSAHTVNLPGQEIKLVKIVVAERTLPFGTKIKRDHLKLVEWPAGSVPKGGFQNFKLLLENEKGQPASRVVINKIFADEPLIKQKISGYGNRKTLSRKVSENKRAFSIRVNDVSGVAGFLLPGDKVDIMLTRKPEGSKGKNSLVTDVILQNVTILGIDQLIDDGAEKPVVAKTATVEVDTVQAQKLALAQQIGSLSLTLRNYSDNQESSPGRISLSDLAGLPKKKDKVKSSGTVVHIRRGTSVDYVRMP